MANNISQFSKCSACGACYNACPVDAIKLITDETFYAFKVDSDKCINCGKCVSVCPVNRPEARQDIRGAYAGFHNDGNVVLSSSSGGAFRAVADLVLGDGGVVFGAIYSDDKHSVTFGSSDQTTILQLQKSKYVESCIGRSFRDVENELKNDRKVLFCGAPCQVAGLKRFLKREYGNLITCDFSCGGLPSHKIYSDYLTSLEERYGAKAINVDFRSKAFGWRNHSIGIQFNNGKSYSRIAWLDPYFRGFLGSLSKRDYCYQCDFADNHYADLILADFWLFEKLSKIRNQNGISLIVSNSQKGEEVVEKIKAQMNLQKMDTKAGCYNIKPNHANPKKVERHDAFLRALPQVGLENAVRRYSKKKITFWIVQYLKQYFKISK